MKTVKYLFLCLMDCLSLNVVFTKDFIIGCIQIVVFFTVFLISILTSPESNKKYTPILTYYAINFKSSKKNIPHAK